MRKKNPVLLMILLVVLVACGNTRPVLQEITEENTANQSTNDISYIFMHRSVCFGQCPDYMLELYKNGLVRYTGRNFVEPVGIYEKKFPQSTIQNIFDAFHAKRVDTTRETYERIIADLPGLSYRIEYGSREKKIYNAHFGPEFLKELATMIDSTIRIDKSWTKISDGPKGD